jgi:hypothetical protein
MLAPEQSTLQIAINYIRRDWRVVPIPLGTKAPKINGWTSLHITEDQAPQYFDRDCNIGVILGQSSGGLADDDIDCPEANSLADKILPATPSIFGRKSKPGSHRVFRVAGKVPTIKFLDPVSGKMIHEIRGDGSQTVFPGSTHPSGETIEWSIDGEPAAIKVEELVRAGARLAAHVLGQRYCEGVVAGDDAGLRRALDNLANPAIVERILLWLDDPLATATASFSPTRRTNPPNKPATMDLGPLPPHLQGLEIRALNFDHFNPKFWAEPILAGCAQMHRLRDDAANQGRDAWWHSLGLLAFCEGGDAIAHELSSKHSKYTFEETQRELDGWRRKADGATRCETFNRKSPGVCGKCPHWGKIKSPVSLGIDAPAAVVTTSLSVQPAPFGVLKPPALDDQQRDSTLQPAQKQKELGPKEKLIRIGSTAELWHDKDRVAFATITAQGHSENYAVRSQAFRDWLLDAYGTLHRFTVDAESYPFAPGEQQIKDAINTLAAKARSGAEYQPAVRVAEQGKRIYIDLGTPDWSAVEVSSDGWRTVPTPPVRFLRPAGLLPLPVPTGGGDIREFKSFLNVTDNDFVLIVAWLLGTLRPTGPYPILIINGEQGSGKSMLCRVLRQLSDPNTAALRSYPRDERDLALAAKNGWVLALDNLSGLKNDLSDILCRIATGAAFGTRRLYSDDEEILIEVCRPILLNGIPPLASRADLANRSIVLSLPTMPESERRSEQEFWLAFDEAAPRLLGALLDGVSGALRNLHSVDLRTRMMDFANWAEAGWRAFGLQSGAFEDIYAQNGAQAGEDALDADPLALTVLRLIESKPEWTGTATDLLSALMPYAPLAERDRYWPKDASRLRGNLNRLSPLLRQRGFEIEFSRSANAARSRHISFRKIDKK